MNELSALRWPQMGDEPSCLVVPLGSTEQHGPHLPLATDTAIATALARHLCERRAATLAPAMPYGSSGEHQDFPGTISIGNEVLREFILELARSATCSFDALYFVNGHGGNHAALSSAVRHLQFEGRDVRVFAPSNAADLHAGEFETSLMLHLHPELVAISELVPGDTRPLTQLWPELQRGGVAAVSANGVLGDPTSASAELGARYFAELCAEIEQDFDRWRTGHTQGVRHG